MRSRTTRTVTGLAAAAALVTAVSIGIAGGASAEPGTTEGIMTTQPPQGARATVQVTPNPTTHRGQEVTITGNCGGGTGLKSVLGGFPEHPALENIRIVDAGPDHFVAKATVSQHIGNGVGPVFVDCGGEAGVTLLVTHV
ncbi:hypothetical protein SAMN05421837_116107 [Amycolatopsis pretoriensis]|uniref:Neocarzinostatin family protein n=1 Tax=Amycolatopsis pretoriensis TaxID=218821 RepID=A0A1H5RHX9_9PSEU|nr:hypothetical protein [Amycolatopsis pretoriensis]SEF37929.1 hypothetical protein SAMN05421837_116107 [Amycolatopsis pretoriensis]